MFNTTRFLSLFIVFTTALTSFFLGGLFVFSLLRHPGQTATLVLQPYADNTLTADRKVYASQRGSRFYPWWCEAGSKIAKENIIWFSSPSAAEQAGYSIAKACA